MKTNNNISPNQRQRPYRRSLPGLVAAAGAIAMTAAAAPAVAGGKIELEDGRWISIGAGIRTQFQMVEDAAPNAQDDSTDFNVSNARIYTSGQVHDQVKFTFNTEKVSGEDMEVLDVIAQFELTPAFNIWMGRMLTPADRIEMNGPFYGLSWNQYTVPLYPSDQGGEAGRFGRDEGVTFWGGLDKFQYAVGMFDGLNGYSNQSDKLLFAGRFAYNFLNMEANPGYYTSSTYYGALGNILTAAVSFQSQSDGSGNTAQAGDFSGYTVDVLSETVFAGGGVLTVEGEYKDFDADYTSATPPASASPADPCFCLFDGDAWFVTTAWLFPQLVGPGRVQPYVRFNENNPSDATSSDLTEVGVNYILAGHNARLNANVSSGDAGLSGYPGADVSSFTFGAQLQF